MSKQPFYHLIIALFCALLVSACNETSSPSSGEPATQKVASKASETEQANQLFEEIFAQRVERSPEFQTSLGRTTNMDRWDDLSDAFALETLALDKQNLSALQAIDRNKLDAPTALSYELMQQNLQQRIEDFQWRLHNYPVNQMFGSHSNVPDLLINLHQVSDVASAEAYIARLKAVPGYFNQLISGLEKRADNGIIPPKFVFDHVLRDCRNVIKGAPFEVGEDSTLLTDFKTKLGALTDREEAPLQASEAKRLLGQANAALSQQVKPAYNKLIAALSQLQQRATTDDGIWKVPQGAEYYNVALQRTTTTAMSAEEIHQLGLSEVARIHDEMRTIKDQVGYRGDLAKFMRYVREDKQFVYPNTEAGRARYLAEATALIETMKGRLEELFLRLPKADIRVKAVEAFREQSAGKAFYQQPSEDGSRPGLYYANLYDMAAMPTYQMEALAYHEGIPGHHMQIAIAMELDGIPTFRKFSRYTAYTEGWGLYSEMIPKEIGFYTDPYSDFGRLAMELWRACRLVVDTGIHAKKWTRQQGIDYYVNNTPNAVSDAVKMVERHIVMPSQATAYKVGMLKIWQLREAAKASLGEQFDIREFHDEILKYGPLPLNVVERKVAAWVAAKQG